MAELRVLYGMTLFPFFLCLNDLKNALPYLFSK